MGVVIELSAWRERHEPDVLRLERAVLRLDHALAGVERAAAPRWLATEVLAIQGCISMDLLREAAERAERLASSWSDRGSRPARGAARGSEPAAR